MLHKEARPQHLLSLRILPNKELRESAFRSTEPLPHFREKTGSSTLAGAPFWIVLFIFNLLFLIDIFSFMHHLTTLAMQTSLMLQPMQGPYSYRKSFVCFQRIPTYLKAFQKVYSQWQCSRRIHPSSMRLFVVGSI